ncbi:MAG: hypothetical protein GY729_21915 [Desulfobacteraceae bacterium]|nr:hypothetical protein [Desulfobacteraceae bacterium]
MKTRPSKLNITILMILFLTMGTIHLSHAQTIKYTGSSTIGIFMKNAAKVYKDVNFKIIIRPGDTGNDTAVIFSDTDILGVARHIEQGHLAAGSQKHLIGKDAIGIWINTRNPVQNLDCDQLAAIFTGKITNWKKVGGDDAKINVYIANENSATHKVFQNIILKGKEYSGKRIKAIKPDPAILNAIARDQTGIGQLSLALAVGNRYKDHIKTICVNGQDASAKNTGYPVFRPLYLITHPHPRKKEKKFITWALSDQGQEVVKKNFIGFAQ